MTDHSIEPSAQNRVYGARASGGPLTPGGPPSRDRRDSERTQTPSLDVPYDWVLRRRDWVGLLARVREAPWAVVDLETTGLDPYADAAEDGFPTSIVLAAVTLPSGTAVVPWSHPDSPFRGQWRTMARDLSGALLDARLALANHNLRFDLLWLWRFCGVDLLPLFAWDTSVAAYMLDERSSWKLKEVVPRLVPGLGSWADVDLTRGAHRTDLFALGHYAARDTHWTHWLWRWQQQRLGADFEAAHELRLDAVAPSERADARLAMHYHTVALANERVLHVMERAGLMLDAEVARGMLAAEQQRADEALVTLRDADPDLFDDPPTGKVSLAPTSKFWRAFTARAVEREDLRVVDHTPQGNAQWTKAILVRLARDDMPLAQAVLDWRDADKRSQFLAAWPRYVSSADGRVHANYRSTSTVTGRTSCANPNLQQVSKPLRRAWRAGPGLVLVEADYSQIELRIASWVAPSVPMREAFVRGDDLHSLMASVINGVGIERVLPWMRQGAKAVNFGFLYGMQAQGFVNYAADVYDVAYTYDEAAAAREAYFATWDGLTEWHERVAVEAQRTGQVVSPLGRIRRVPAAMYGDDWEAGAAVRQAINSPVQSAASDLLLLAGASVAGLLRGHAAVEGVTLVGEVHDSLLLAVEERDWEQRVDAVLERMTQAVPRWLWRTLGVEVPVPLDVEAEVAEHWSASDAVVVERRGTLAVR